MFIYQQYQAKNNISKDVRRAKHDWRAHRFDGLREGQNPGTYWESVKELRKGLATMKAANSGQWFKDKAGVKSKTVEDNNRALKEHWEGVFNLPVSVDARVLDRVKQRPIIDALSALPSDKEIMRCTRNAKKGKAPGDNGIPIEFWQAFLPEKKLEESPDAWTEGERETFALYREVVHKVWEEDSCPEEWLIGRLKMLYKGKGAKDILDNWRGIMLLDVAAKVVGAIIAIRLGEHVEGIEEQNGFRSNRGTVDGLFSLKLALHKRKEHGYSSWVVYVDLVKAFDSVPREGLYTMLNRMGVPDKLINLIVRMHTNCIVKVKTGDSDIEVESNVGVKQGDSLAPVLFTLYFQACMEVLDEDWTFEKPNFHYKMDDIIMGRRANTKGYSKLDLYRSLYADDGAFLLTSRPELDTALPLICNILKAFGLTMHVGRNGNKAKTEAVFYPSANRAKNPDPDDVTDIEVDGGLVCFNDKFRYLGCIISNNLKDEAECDARISAAARAFGALKQQIFNVKGIETRAKKHAYVSLVLSILLYGSEAWVLSEVMKYNIRTFHRRCLRFMCGINITKMRASGVHHVDLERRLGMANIFDILAARRVQWLGHTYRMEETRLPRRLLTSWVPRARPNGRPHLTYAHGVVKDLVQYNIGKEGWGAKAEDREGWRATVRRIRGVPKKQKRFRGGVQFTPEGVGRIQA